MDNEMASDDDTLGSMTGTHDSSVLNDTHGGADAATGDTANELDTDTSDVADTESDDGYADDDDDSDTATGGVTGGAGTI